MPCDEINEELFPQTYEHSGDPSGEYLRQEEQRQIWKVINQLDHKHKTVLVLYYFNEFGTKEVAKITGCLEGTVKSRLYTARKQLKKKLRIAETEVGKC